MAIQLKTARLTVLVDPPRKLAFERACRDNDMTPSQVLRHLMREYVEAQQAKGAPARRASSAPKPANARHG